MKKNVRNITYGGLFIALCVLFPMLFHTIGGAQAGRIFLPMHIPVLLAGFIAGPFTGALTGIVGPLLSGAFTGMPAGPMLISMPIELCLYGLFAGIFYYKFKINIYISLLLSMICGRIVLAGILLLLTGVLKINTIGAAAVFTSIVTAIPGIVIQIVLIPVIILGLKRVKVIGYDSTTIN